ncbi:uncharacterized protein AC631_03844 [Debaryomyces fabryi]|uniref:Uncharacterized protein n=1 Tax=Debaryomyces fabryi TaxID=58627 RepID=A0A0V1PVZ2_9ASCO|nr:uncharacterized protein AC631_03844 [Debaryomyces fabryi]KSA00417.1 hypothetical protein AC631_03844 [Debaryomyces fabryi]CUM54135.1 unnamed protein product [Debaryomyces fabryi]
MSRYDDTIEQLKKKNIVLRNHLTDLINDEDNTEINILKQVMVPSRSTEERLNTTKSSMKTNQEWRNEPGIKVTTKDQRGLLNQAYKNDDVSMTTKRAHREYFNKFKENINEIKNTDYQLPMRQNDSNISEKLKEIQLNDQNDKLELKKKENLLLNKLNEKDEMISSLQNKVKTLQQENRQLVGHSHEYKHQLQIEREQNKNLRKFEIDSKLASSQSRNEEILNLKSKLHELSEQKKVLFEQNQANDMEVKKCQTTIKDLTIKLIMYKKSNNSANEKIDRLRLIKSLLTTNILKETSTRDDTESLLDSTTIRLISQAPSDNYFTQHTNFSACDAKAKFRILIKMVMFIIRVQNLCKNEVNFKSQILQLLND